MKKMIKMSLAAAMMMGIGAVSAQAEGLNILDNVYAKGQIRARYENVDQDNALKNANAFTNRLAVGVGGDLFGTDWLSAFVEFTDVRNINDNYNSTDNGEGTYSVVADPEQTRLSQSYIDLKYGKTKLRVGRQEIALDNHRFIGTVPWRQMFQTFDAYTLTNNSIDGLNIFASFATQRNMVLNANRDTRDLFLNVSYKVMPALKVTAYSYMLASQHDTYGLALTGKLPVSDSIKLSYRAEYATQDDASFDQSSGPDDVKADADYFRFDLGMNMSGILAGVGYESLSGANGTDTAFKTPYATLHGQNGWADIFLGNGGNANEGLEDASVYLGYKSKGFGLFKVVFHDYQSDVGGIDYGTEVDAVYKNKIPGVTGLSGLLKIADYRADDNIGATGVTTTIDKTVVWAMLTYNFSSK